MSAYVKVPRKALRRAVDLLGTGAPALAKGLIAELESLLKPRPSKPLRKERLKQKARKKEAKRDETAVIRARCVLRGGNKCERCGIGPNWFPLELDHAFGRARVKQTERNCWVLCRLCHRRKTDNEPEAAFWLEAFREHCRKHGYTAELWRAQNRLDSLRDIESASRLTTTEGR